MRKRLSAVLARYESKVMASPLDAPPATFTMHWDIFDAPMGDITTDTVSEFAAYALLAPFMLCPEIQESYLVADLTTALDRRYSVSMLRVEQGAVTNAHWEVEAMMADDGRFIMGKPRRATLEHLGVRSAVVAVLAARMRRDLLSDAHSYEFAVRAAIETLEQLNS